MFELHLLCPEGDVELISDAVMELDALSVSVEDADADTDAERALFGEPGMAHPLNAWTRSRVVALFETESAAQEAVRVLAVQDFFVSSNVVSITHVPEQDWVRMTQSQFAPVLVTEDFFIVPTWCELPATAKQVIRLDPGLAFGTGTHPTTLMCLRWIAAQANQGIPLGQTLDYGCGSGILAIAAKKYGASCVHAVDIDPAAVTSSKANAQANLEEATVQTQMVIGLPDCVSQQSNSYNTVLANILASPLKVLAPLLCGHVAKGGHLVLAGILERQTEELTLAYAPYAQLRIADRMDGWVLMTASLS